MFEFKSILTHQYIGNAPAIKSPHLPLDFKDPEDSAFSLGFLFIIASKIIIKYKLVKKKKRDHHQYCHTNRCTTLELLASKKDALNWDFALKENSKSFNICEFFN